MAKKMVKCAVCGASFDRNAVQSVKYNSRRYAHLACFPSGELVEMENPPDDGKTALTDYITKLFNGTVNWGVVGKQIKTYQETYNYSFSGILKSLIYAYEIKHNDINKAHGIGIVPFVYTDAFNYYYSIWEAQQRNQDKPIYTPKEEVIVIPPPQRNVRKMSFFKFLDEEETP